MLEGDGRVKLGDSYYRSLETSPEQARVEKGMDKTIVSNETELRAMRDVIQREMPAVKFGFDKDYNFERGINNQNWTSDLVSGLYNAGVSTVKGIASLPAAVGIMTGEGKDSWASDWYNSVESWADRNTMNYSDAGQKGIFGGGGIAGLWAGLGNGLGTILTMWGGGSAVKGATMGLTGLSKVGQAGQGLSVLDKVNKANNYAKWSQRAGGFMTSTAQMYPSIYKEGIDAGLNPQDAMKMAMGISGLVSLTETAGLEMLGKVGSRPLTNNLAKQSVKENLGKLTAKEITPELLEESSKMTMKSFAQKAKGYGIKMFEGGAIEGGQEFGQTYIEEFSKYLYDQTVGESGAKYGANPFSKETFMKAVEGGIVGGLIGGGMTFTQNMARGIQGESAWNVIRNDALKGKERNVSGLKGQIAADVMAEKYTKEEGTQIIENIDKMYKFAVSSAPLNIKSGAVNYQLYQLHDVAETIKNSEQLADMRLMVDNPVIQKAYKKRQDLSNAITAQLNNEMEYVVEEDKLMTKNRGKFDSRMDGYLRLYKDVAKNKITSEKLEKELVKLSFVPKAKEETSEETEIKTGEEVEKKGEEISTEIKPKIESSTEKVEIKTIPVGDIIPTEDLNEKAEGTIADIQRAIKKGEEIKPVEVVETSEGKKLVDGHHRLVAFTRAGKDIPYTTEISPENKEKAERIKKESEPDYNTLVEKAETEKELDVITDQATKANVYTPELMDKIGKQRKTLSNKKEVKPEPKKVSEPVSIKSEPVIAKTKQENDDVKKKEKISKLDEEYQRTKYELQNLKEQKDVAFESHPDVLIAKNLPKILTDSARSETGVAVGAQKDINPSLVSNTGLTVERAAEKIWEDHFAEGQYGYDVQDIRNIIIDILQTGKKNFIDNATNQGQIDIMNNRLSSLQSEMKEMETGLPFTTVDPFMKSEQVSPYVNKSTKNIPRAKEQRSVRSMSAVDGLIRNNPELHQKISEHFKNVFPNVSVEYMNEMLQTPNVFARVIDGVIQINPELAIQSSIVHEYGEIFVEMLGDNHPWIKAGLKTVEGSEFHKWAKETYPELSSQEQLKEALIQAIAERSVDALSAKFNPAVAPKFMEWLTRFWSKVKGLFTKNKSSDIVKLLANELTFNSQPVKLPESMKGVTIYSTENSVESDLMDVASNSMANRKMDLLINPELMNTLDIYDPNVYYHYAVSEIMDAYTKLYRESPDAARKQFGSINYVPDFTKSYNEQYSDFVFSFISGNDNLNNKLERAAKQVASVGLDDNSISNVFKSLTDEDGFIIDENIVKKHIYEANQSGDLLKQISQDASEGKSIQAIRISNLIESLEKNTEVLNQLKTYMESINEDSFSETPKNGFEEEMKYQKVVNRDRPFSALKFVTDIFDSINSSVIPKAKAGFKNFVDRAVTNFMAKKFVNNEVDYLNNGLGVVIRTEEDLTDRINLLVNISKGGQYNVIGAPNKEVAEKVMEIIEDAEFNVATLNKMKVSEKLQPTLTKNINALNKIGLPNTDYAINEIGTNSFIQALETTKEGIQPKPEFKNQSEAFKDKIRTAFMELPIDIQVDFIRYQMQRSGPAGNDLGLFEMMPFKNTRDKKGIGFDIPQFTEYMNKKYDEVSSGKNDFIDQNKQALENEIISSYKDGFNNISVDGKLSRDSDGNIIFTKVLNTEDINNLSLNNQSNWVNNLHDMSKSVIASNSLMKEYDKASRPDVFNVNGELYRIDYPKMASNLENMNRDENGNLTDTEFNIVVSPVTVSTKPNGPASAQWSQYGEKLSAKGIKKQDFLNGNAQWRENQINCL